jgi:hypothetical protein
LAEFADALERFAELLKAGPSNGYKVRRIELSVWDQDDAGGEVVDEVEFEEGDAELLSSTARRASELAI